MKVRKIIYTSLSSYFKDLKPNEHILLDDGKMEVKITRVINDTDVEAEIIRGGILHSNKGFNLPNSNVKPSRLN